MSEVWDDRRKALEEEYFRRKEKEALEKLRAEMAAERQAAGISAVAVLQCPRCDGALQPAMVDDVQIDRCDKCGGVWLDAGELERLTRREPSGWLSRLWRGNHELEDKGQKTE